MGRLMRSNISKIKATALLVAFLCLISFGATKSNAKNTPNAHVYYSLGDENKAPLTKSQTDFSCTDQIFTVAELSNYPKGKYQLSIRWIDPSDNVRENTRYPFDVTSSRITKLWAWLTLSRAKGAGILAWMNPAAGLEEFVGEWTVEVQVDNKVVNTGSFIVSC